MSFNHVLPFPSETCQLGVPLKEFERRIHDRPSLILLPVPGTDDGAGVCTALLVAGRTRLGTLDALLFEAGVIDNGHRVVLRAPVGAVHARRKDVVQLRLPGGLRHLGLARKVHLKAVLRVDVLLPFLGDCGSRHRQHQRGN